MVIKAVAPIVDLSAPPDTQRRSIEEGVDLAIGLHEWWERSAVSLPALGVTS